MPRSWTGAIWVHRSMPPLKTRPAAPPGDGHRAERERGRAGGRGQDDADRGHRGDGQAPADRPVGGEAREDQLADRPRDQHQEAGRADQRVVVDVQGAHQEDRDQRQGDPVEEREERPRGHQHPPEDGPLGGGHLQAQRQRPARADGHRLRQGEHDRPPPGRSRSGAARRAAAAGRPSTGRSRPPMPGPKPRPRRTETEPSTATKGVRPGGAASTRKAVQVPKKAPVARPWIARATSSPVEVRLGDEDHLRHRQGRERPQQHGLAPDPVRELAAGQHRGHERRDVAAEEERHDRVAEAEAVLVERDQRGDQAGAEREEHQHRPGAPDPAHAPTSRRQQKPPRSQAPSGRRPRASQAATRRRGLGRADAREHDRRRRAGDPGQELGVGAGGDVREQDPPGDLGRRERPEGRPAHRHRPRRPAAARLASAWATARGSTSTRQHRPAPERRPGLGQQPRAAAGVERRAGRRGPRGPPGTWPWWRGRPGRSPRRGSGPARARRPGRPGGRGCAGTSRPAWPPAGRASRGPRRARGRGRGGTRGRPRPPRGRSAARRSRPRPRGAPAAAGTGAARPAPEPSGATVTASPGGSTGASLGWAAVALTAPSAPAAARRRRPARGWPRSTSTSAWRSARAHARRSPPPGEAIVNAAVAEVGQPRRFAARELGLGARPARRAARPGRGDPAAAGAGGLRDDDPRVGALRGGARLARGQLAGLGADARGRLGARRRQRRPGAPLLARAGHHRPGARRAGRALARGRGHGGRPAGPEAEPLVWDPGVHAVVTHASTRTCKRQLAGLGAAYARGRALSPLHPRGLGQRRDDRAGGRRPRRRRGRRRPRRLRQRGPALHGGQADRGRARGLGGLPARAWSRPSARSGSATPTTRRPTSPRWPRGAPAPRPARRSPGRSPPAARCWWARASAGPSSRRRSWPCRARPSAGWPSGARRPSPRCAAWWWPRTPRTPWRSPTTPPSRSGRRSSGRARRSCPACAPPGCSSNEGPLYQDAHLVVGGVGDSGMAGARPKVEQLVWARRVHRAAAS